MVGRSHSDCLRSLVKSRMRKDEKRTHPFSAERSAIMADCLVILDLLDGHVQLEAITVAQRLGWEPPIEHIGQPLNYLAQEWLDAQFPDFVSRYIGE